MDAKIRNIKDLDSGLISLNPWKSSIQYLDSGVGRQLPLAQVVLVHQQIVHAS